MSVGATGSNWKQPEPGATARTRAKTRAGLGARGRGSGHPAAWGLDTTSRGRGPPSVVDLQLTRGFRWGISMSRSGESYASVVTGAELRGRTFERPPEAAPERLGAHRARCGQPPLHTCRYALRFGGRRPSFWRVVRRPSGALDRRLGCGRRHPQHRLPRAVL